MKNSVSSQVRLLGEVPTGGGKVERRLFSQTEWLVQTKLRAPLVRDDMVPRRRLHDALGQAITSYPVTMVSAPAGYGKTTLLASLPRILPELPVVWVALDADDNDPIRFLSTLSAALKMLRPASGTEASALVVADLPPDTHADMQAHVRRTMCAIINDILDTLPEPFVLVLDDLHVVEKRSVYAALDYLLDHLPPQMRLVIGTRNDPPLSLGRLAARRRLAELRREDLSFTAAEADALLRGTLGLDLSPEDLATLQEKTEGWAAGLCLLTNSLDRIATTDGRRAFLRGLVQTERIFDFLTEEVLASLDPDLRTFLLETSILAELTPELSRAVTGRSDAPLLLKELYRRNLFLVATNEGQTGGETTLSYRYHHLFREFLRQRLQWEMPERVKELHRRAAEAEILASRAIGHYLAAELWESAVRVIAEIGWQFIHLGMANTVRTWIQPLPQTVQDAHSKLINFMGVAAFIKCDYATAQRFLRRARRAFAEAGDWEAEGDVLGLLAVSARRMEQPEGLAGFVNEALDRLTVVNGRPLLLMARVWTHCLKGDWSLAARDFQEATIAAGDSRDPTVFSGFVYTFEAPYGTLPGCLDRAEQYCRKAFTLLTESDDPIRMALEDKMAFIHLWRGRLSEAITAADRALVLKERLGGYPLIGLNAAMYAAVTSAARGEFAEADRYWTRLLQQLKVPVDPPFVIYLYALGRIRWLQGQLTEARQSYTQLCAAESRTETPLAPYLRKAMGGMLALAEGRYTQAEELLRHAAALEQSVPMAVAVGSARLLLSRLYLERGRPEAALSELIPVMLECRENNLPGIILQEGAAIAPVLRLAANQSPEAVYASYLLDLMGPLASSEALPAAAPGRRSTLEAPPEQAVKPEAPLMPLTAREIDVLHLIAIGASNRAIAERLVIGEQTVKSHVVNILRKLNVTSRTQAAARAHVLGLVDHRPAR